MDESLKEIRRTNLLRLLEGFPREKEFAFLIGIEPSYLSRIKKDQAIGDKIARDIEHAVGKPYKWLDTPLELQQQLAAYDVQPEPQLTQEEKMLLENFRALCPDQRAALKTVSDALAQSAPNKKTG